MATPKPTPRFALLLWLALSCLGAAGAHAEVGEIETWQRQGARVYHLYAPQPAIVDVRLLFRAGSFYSAGNSSVAHLCNSMLGRATRRLAEDELDLQLGLLGVRTGRDIDRDGASLSMRTLSQNAPKALELLREIITEPRWDEAGLELAKARSQDSIERAFESGRSRLGIESYRQLYGKHPYATMVVGDKDDIAEATIAQLRDFHNKRYTAQNMSVLVVGDIRREAIDAWLDDTLSSMPQGKAPSPVGWIKATPLPKLQRAVLDSSQTHWSAITLGLVRSHTDYPLLELSLFMLDKLIDERLRDEMGLTYSAGAYSSKLVGRGMVSIYFSTRAESEQAAIAAARKQMQGFFARGIDEEGLERATTHLAGLLSISFNSNSSMLDLMEIIAKENLPTDYLDRLIERISSATVEEVNGFLRSYFGHRRFSQISVGPSLPSPSAPSAQEDDAL